MQDVILGGDFWSRALGLGRVHDGWKGRAGSVEGEGEEGRGRGGVVRTETQWDT